ncbi:MAG: hypothetical protein JXR97_00900 [Planctomycetes bacterium]|nr:hypothetical protein [Planctomycetota bacterium]
MAQLLQLLTQLREGGHVIIPDDDHTSALRTDGVIEELRQLDKTERLNSSEKLPEVNYEIASSALLLIYRACQFIVYRDIPEQSIRSAFRASPSPDGTAVRIWSVDIAFRYIPGLIKMAKGLNPDDPLVEELKTLATTWPFSSVGVKLDKDPEISAILGNPGLCRMYIDRIVERNDSNRARQEGIIEHFIADSGMYPELLDKLDLTVSDQKHD